MRRTDPRGFCYEHDLGAKHFRNVTMKIELTPEDDEVIGRLLNRPGPGTTASDEFLDAAGIDP